jgi:hypothetical protein
MFVSGTGTQGVSYSVGPSGAKSDWFIWANGNSGVDNNGNFGVDNKGNLYAKAGNIASFALSET